VNAERKKEQMGPVSYELFEVIIDKLEKEWFNLVSCLKPMKLTTDQAHPATTEPHASRGLQVRDMR
jgi:hypothetical protein